MRILSFADCESGAIIVRDEQLAADGIYVHQGISPNGDGNNDILVIDGITAYPENRLMIMNPICKVPEATYWQITYK